MGLIKNIEIWNNQRPLVCNFDIFDYCTSGGIGNTCTDNTAYPNLEELSITATATSDAWFKAVNQYFEASLSFYMDTPYVTNTGQVIVPEDLFNDKCNTIANYNEICNMYYGQNGFIEKSLDFRIKRSQLINSLFADGDPAKLNGIHTYTLMLPNGISTAIPYTYTIDYTNYQTPNYDTYLEYRTVLGEMMQSIKQIIYVTSNSSLTSFDIPDQCSIDSLLGTQTWKTCNLDVTTYRNGDTIPYVSDPVAWSNLTTGAWCYYLNDSDYGPVMGKLYNWYAVNDPRGLAPVGYHIPTTAEWTTLVNFAGGFLDAGGVLKTYGSSIRSCITPSNCANWDVDNITTNLQINFLARPAGFRASNGTFQNMGSHTYYWTSSEYDAATAWQYSLYNANQEVTKTFENKKNGYSIRIIKD